ncbi:MAG: hypothetical protein J6S26_04870 [Solobacterium sp.]|nr:hypothetical protein [Solobacterium sp.]
MIQEQYEPKQQNNLSDEAEETEEKELQAPAKKKPKLLLFLVTAAIAVLCVMNGRYVRENTTLFMNDRTPEGYLPLKEYELIDPETGEVIQKVRGTSYNDIYAFGYSQTQYVTSRGIGNGSSWDEFVEAYGDCRSEFIFASPALSISGNRETEKYFCYDMTVREFDEQYIKSGIINPQYYTIHISFGVYTDGFNVQYDIGGMLENREAYSEQRKFLRRGQETPVEGVFSLTFSIDPAKREGVLVPEVDTITSTFERINEPAG